jgi:glycosyl transferase family 25
MHAFFINLPKDVERRISMENQLKNLSIPYDIISATVGVNLNLGYRDKIYNHDAAIKENGHPLSDTQIACADSHRRIYEKIIKDNIPWALILEDDVVLDKRILEILNSDYIKNAEADWLQIDYIPFNATFLRQWWRATKQNTLRQPLFIFYALIKILPLLAWGVFENIRERTTVNPQSAIFLRPLYLAGAYIITNEGARKLQPLVNPIKFAADRVQNQGRIKAGLKLRGIVPLLSHQNRISFTSNIIYDNQ